MIITNKSVITTKDQNNLQPLHDFVQALFETFNIENGKELSKDDFFEEGTYAYYRIPTEIPAEVVINEGAELAAVDGTELIELPGTTLTQYQHVFNAQESEENARSMARARREVRELKAAKAQSNANYDAKIKEADATLDKYGSFVETGFDNREEKCIVVIDFKERKRHYKSIITKEIVKEEDLQPQDKQMMMVFPPSK